MTTDEFIQKLNAKIEAIEKEDKPLQIAVRSVMALQSKRIFFEGKNTNGSAIGVYSGRPVYVNPNNSPVKFTPRGKPSGEFKIKVVGFEFNEGTLASGNIVEGKVFKKGKLKKSSGANRLTGYFENYLAYKKKIGRNRRIGTVDLFLSGDLHRNWANAEVVGKVNPIRINQHNYVVRLSEKNLKKVARYGKVFNPSNDEKKIFLNIVQTELAKALR